MTCTETPHGHSGRRSPWRCLVRWAPYAALAVAAVLFLVACLRSGQYLFAVATPLMALGVLPLLPRLSSRPAGDLEALQRKQEMDERRKAIELRAGDATFRLAMAVVLGAGVALIYYWPQAVGVGVLGVLALCAANAAFQYYYSRRM